MLDAAVRVTIAAEGDVLSARRQSRELARDAGFSIGDQTVIATAVSEIARNILLYAGRGEVSCDIVTTADRRALTIVARDQGPGIADVELALQEGYSTAGGLGLGLPGARRLMDEFSVVSAAGGGTTITMRKWGRSG
jgi:serine/threonine-protein kinase RsbT